MFKTNTVFRYGTENPKILVRRGFIEKIRDMILKQFIYK